MDIQRRAIIELVKHDLQAACNREDSLEQRIYRLTNAVGTLLNLFELPTTVEPTQTAPTTVEPSGAEEPTYLVTRQSSPSAPVDTGSGLVELHSVCANVHRRMVYLNEAEDNPYRALFAWEWCPISAEPVLKSSVRIPAQGAEATSSISVKQPSKESVENSVEESVKSQLNELIETFTNLAAFQGISDKDKGYREGMLTAQSVVELKLRQLTRSK